MNRRLEGFQDYIYEHVTAKRADPQDDMVSFLCGVHYEALDRKLTDIEIAGIVHAMILGGLETTQYALEEQAQLLCEHPGVFEQLRTDRSQAARLRRGGAAPARADARSVDPDDHPGRGLPGRRRAGRIAAAPALRARRTSTPTSSPARSSSTSTVAGIGRHVTFSTGPRVCPGATLSRLEQQIAWGVLLDRLESIEYGDGNDWLHQPGIMLGTLQLHLRIRRAGPS